MVQHVRVLPFGVNDRTAIQRAALPKRDRRRLTGKTTLFPVQPVGDRASHGDQRGHHRAGNFLSAENLPENGEGRALSEEKTRP